MLAHYLKITFRSLWKNKLFVTINIIGLGVALACCIVSFLNWDYNNKFDSIHINADKIYRINFYRNSGGRPMPNGIAPLPLGENIKDAIGQIDQVVRYYPTGGNFKVGDQLFGTSVTTVDPEFFDVFSFNIMYGDASSIKDKRTILISTELRERHFPDLDNPVGEIVIYINGDTRIEYRIGGVFEKPPLNSSFQAQAYVHYDNLLDLQGWDPQDWSLFNNTFVTLNNPDDIPVIESQLQNYVQIQNEAKRDFMVESYYLDPFVGMAVRAEKEDIRNHWLSESLPTAAAVAPGIMGLLILLIACFNFTNTSIAIANQRIKEIGIRKVLGSGKKQLVGQFLAENVILCFFSLVFGLIIAMFLVPAYSAMWAFLDIQMDLLHNPSLLVFLGALLLFTGLVAGSYPAFYVSRFQASTIFRGTVKFSGTNALTRILLTLQFAISLIAIVSGIVFARNAAYQEKFDLGFDLESVVYAYVKDESGYRKMRNELQGYDQIKDLAGSRHSVTSSWYTDPIKYQSQELDVSILEIGDNYLATIGATLLEGRDFMENSQTDVDRSVIINKELSRQLGWENPIDKRIVLRDTIDLYVIGVVKDIFIEGALWDPLEPMLMRYVKPDRYRFLSVKADMDDLAYVKNLMDNKWKNIFPDELSTVGFMEGTKAESAEVNKNIKILFIFLGIIAIVLSAIGLFSLVSLNLNKRMKEIGVRKVLGASSGDISLIISKEFIIVLLISSTLGSVAGYFLSNMLMESIWSYYVPLTPVVFVLSILILFFICLLTIGRKIFQAASTVPVQYLRDI